MSQGKCCFRAGASQMGISGPGPSSLRGRHSICSTNQCFSRLSLPITDSEDDGESEAAKQLIQPIAEKIIAKYKAKEEEAPLLFFVAGEVGAAGAWPTGCSADQLLGSA